MTQPLPGRSARWKETHFMLCNLEEGSVLGQTLWKIAVSRKVVRLATQRNRWKRRIREVLRKHRGSIRTGYEATLRVHTAGGPLRHAELEREILELLHQSRLWVGGKG